MTQTAAEHFKWAVDRAMEYVDRDEGGYALSSLVSDLGKHPGTRSIMTRDLQVLAMGELLTGGAAGMRQFIEGIPTPIEKPCIWCGRTDTERVPVNSMIGHRGERCADPDDCMEAKKQRDRDLNSRFLGFKP